MNTALKSGSRQKDQFALTTENTLQWANKNRKPTLVFGAIAIALILILVGAYGLYQHRSAAAQTAFGEAMQVYQTPLARPGQPVPAGVASFNSARERATKANALFASVAHQYNLTEPGRLAQYFTGLTFIEAGQDGPAEDALHKSSGSWNGDIAALSKDALAQLYAGNGKQAQAVDLLQQLAKGHATTVPPELAQFQLAELYTTQGKIEQGRQIYAQIQDHDKDAKGKPGFASQMAGRKLNPTATTVPGAQ